MKISHDPEVDALYIYLLEIQAVESEEQWAIGDGKSWI